MVTGGSLLDVFTEEVLVGWGVAVAAGRVACTMVDPKRWPKGAPSNAVVEQAVVHGLPLARGPLGQSKPG